MWLVCWLAVAAGVELTFELPDNAKECFYEEIEKGTACSLEFQVGDGGGAAPVGTFLPIVLIFCVILVLVVFSGEGSPDVWLCRCFGGGVHRGNHEVHAPDRLPQNHVISLRTYHG